MTRPGRTLVRGVLEHEIPVRLEEMNGTGCVLASHRPMVTGTSGVLRVSLRGTQFSDEVQIVRCQALSGAGDRYHLEAAFLWVTPPTDGSLRHMVAELGLDRLASDGARLVLTWA